MRIVSLAVLTVACLVLAVSPAMADTTLYSNGPVDGTTDAWTINFGFSVSDSFFLSADPKVRTLHLGLWLFPGDSPDSLTSVEMQLGSTSFGNQYTDQVLNATGQTNLFINGFGLQVAIVDFSFPDVDLPLGTSWLTVQNATDSLGQPVYWDENSGPSSAFENTLGSIPSESFTLGGIKDTTTPEPSSILLFASGILGVAGVLRRKLMG